MHFEEIKIKDTLKEWRDKINKIIVHNKSADFLLIEDDVNLDYEQHNGRILLFKNEYGIFIPNNINSESGFKCTIKNSSLKTLTITTDSGVYINDSLSGYEIKNNESVTIAQYSSAKYYVIEDSNKSLEEKVTQIVNGLPTVGYVDNQDNKRLLISDFNNFKTNTFNVSIKNINENIDTRVLKTDFNTYKTNTDTSITNIENNYNNLATVAKSGEYSDLINKPLLTTISTEGSLENSNLYATVKYDDKTINFNLHNSLEISNNYDDLINLPTDIVHQQQKQEITGEKTFMTHNSFVVSMGEDNDIDIAKGRFFVKNITENCTLTIINTDSNGSNPSEPQKNLLTTDSNQTVGTVIYLKLTTDNDNYTVTWGNESNLIWDVSEPVLKSNKLYIVKFITFDSGSNWFGSY